MDQMNDLTLDVGQVQSFAEKLVQNLEKVIVGKRQALEQVVLGLLCQGHLLIEDVPGVGKTMLARSLAKSIECTFRRIQFTPDMLPSDVTGVYIFNQITREFEFRPGPVMSQIVLADEINRATPKTQSALLEAMEERQVTVDGVTHKLAEPFMVLGTQNPIEYEGTFQLPEAQLDRFLLRVKLGYPSLRDEISILEKQQLTHPIDTLQSVTTVDEVINMQKQIRRVYVSPAVKQYIVELVRATRGSADVYLGSSPRGSLGLFRVGQARAVTNGRDYVLPDDIKAIAGFVLSHRIMIDPAARLREIDPELIIHEVLRVLPVPAGEVTPK
jgi:MoxR-like ATPase